MSECIKCKSTRIASIQGKTSDCNDIKIGEHEHDGYVPDDMNIGGGDYLEFDLCLNCGTVQAEWPLPECNARTNKGTVKRFSKNIQITTTRSGEDTPTTIEFTIKGDKIDEKYVRDFEEWKKMCDELKATHPESDDMYAELWTKLGYTVEFIEFDTHTI